MFWTLLLGVYKYLPRYFFLTITSRVQGPITKFIFFTITPLSIEVSIQLDIIIWTIRGYKYLSRYYQFDNFSSDHANIYLDIIDMTITPRSAKAPIWISLSDKNSSEYTSPYYLSNDSSEYASTCRMIKSMAITPRSIQLPI